LIELLRGLDAHINLIPLNPTQGFGGAATHAEAVVAFKDVIRAADIPCTIRQRRGIDVAAGCGQLQATTVVWPLPFEKNPPHGGKCLFNLVR
jgi:23S rRNA (adenine2503-C2)-methyltransferase